jgi:succinate dehydrogenase/fumarate reductase-like Fe-S protein
MEFQILPYNNSKGEKTTPVIWDMNCLEEVCGACSMVINGQARQFLVRSTCKSRMTGNVLIGSNLIGCSNWSTIAEQDCLA